MRTILIALIIINSVILYGQQKNILIYTHNGKGYVHDNIATSVQAITELCQSQKWNVTVSDTPIIFDNLIAAKFNCIVFANTNNEAFATETQRLNFKQYIQSGGGFVGIHSASGSERNWPWFWAMLGGKFVRHPKLQPFQINVIDTLHSATKHLPKIWQWEDEFYYLNQLNPDVHVLLAGDLTKLDDDKQNEYPAQTFGNQFPLAWCHTFDGGRQFYTALGHKKEYYADPNFRKHILGGLKWAMNLK